MISFLRFILEYIHLLLSCDCNCSVTIVSAASSDCLIGISIAGQRPIVDVEP